MERRPHAPVDCGSNNGAVLIVLLGSAAVVRLLRAAGGANAVTVVGAAVDAEANAATAVEADGVLAAADVWSAVIDSRGHTFSGGESGIRGWGQGSP